MGIQTNGPNYGDFINLIQPNSSGDPYSTSVSQMGSNAPVGGPQATDTIASGVAQQNPLNLQTTNNQNPANIQLNNVDPANPDIPIILALVHLDEHAEVQGKNVFGAANSDQTSGTNQTDSANSTNQTSQNIQGTGSVAHKPNAFLSGSAAINFLTVMQELFMSMMKNKEQQGSLMLTSSNMIFAMAKDTCAQIEEKGKLDQSNAMAAAVGAAISLAGTIAGGAVSLKGALGKESFNAKLPNETQLAKIQSDFTANPTPGGKAALAYDAQFGQGAAEFQVRGAGRITAGGNGNMITIENPAQLKQMQALNNQQPFGGGEKLEIGMKVDQASGLTPAGKAVNLKIVNENRALAGMGPIDNPAAKPTAAEVAKIKETRVADNAKIDKENAEIGHRNDARAQRAAQIGDAMNRVGASAGEMIKNATVAANAVDIAYTEQQKTILEALKQLYQQQLSTATEAFKNDTDSLAQIVQTVQTVREKLNDAQSAAIRH